MMIKRWPPRIPHLPQLKITIYGWSTRWRRIFPQRLDQRVHWHHPVSPQQKGSQQHTRLGRQCYVPVIQLQRAENPEFHWTPFQRLDRILLSNIQADT